MQKQDDYLLTLTIKNQRLLAMMKERGISSALQLSKQAGIPYQSLVSILSFRMPAYGRRGQLLKPVSDLCDFFMCDPEDIYPYERLYSPIAASRIEAAVSAEQFRQLVNTETDCSLLLENSEMQAAFSELVGRLPARERKVISMRFGLEDGQEKTYREIAQISGLSPGRIQQIEKEALRRLRRPQLSRDFVQDWLEA